ncbi:RNA 2',3'-cyclic phosphodiesterase [Croceicoccus sp. F390]|uniref:RNA 2',3'-cyclic phosphodiesterase n=1 Tax=Croceicoccus esteveae TaxID=3075597 RepID=A0ABU2ZGD5_9SPHN|nr:RNA 2',3'-cyclic phosphodiesterase [Croceicoccus sp. F390]MDT0575148.1 RNA 2',3'-cyclic phosphodiesterase [Croceicoccus sp. F390]
MHRIFIGIAPPPQVCGMLVDAMHGIEHARWQTSEQLHCTLCYVGEIVAPLANDLADALGTIRQPPFKLLIDGVGHFTRKDHPSAVYAAISGDAGLEALRRKVNAACRSCGIVPDARRFIPHVTLARLNRSSGPIGPFLSVQARLASEPFAVNAFTLYESHLGNAGSFYEPVLRYALR